MTSLPDLPLDGLYGEMIMDHFRHPRRRQPVQNPDAQAREYNPVCGDLVELQIKVDAQGLVAETCATSEGCSIIQASASMLAESLVGRTVQEAETLTRRFREMMQGKNSGEPPESSPEDSLGDLESLKVVRMFPVRIKCALLPWVALEETLAKLKPKA